MKKTHILYDEKRLLFQEIVESIPDEVVAFFQKFESSRDRLTLTQEADVLNAVAREEYLACAGTGGKSVRRPTALMRWYEVFRDIYILSRARSSNDSEIKKNPNGFATFARTFEPLAFLPDFWFAAARNVSSPDIRDRGHGLRLAFERFLYECAGGGVWGAMDWEMNRFLQRRIYETLKSDERGALRRIAALALTARAVAAGELGLYVEERDDVTLPLSGFSNVQNDPRKQNPLLKYYHYDRFTQLSFAREHEFAMDPNVTGTHMRFERQWVAMAVLSDVILKESDAHSTNAAATRVMLESVSQCMLKIKSKFRGQPAHKKILAAADTIYNLVALRPDEFAQLSEAELLKQIGVRERPVESRFYLDKCGFANASAFWAAVMPIFHELDDACDANRDRVVAKYTEEQRREAFKDPRSTVQFVRNALDKGNVSELPGAVGRTGVRDALMSLMLEGAASLQYAVMDKVLTGDDAEPVGRVSFWSEERRVARVLPARMPFADGETAQFRGWIVSYLTDLSSQCAAEKNEAIRGQRDKWIQDWHKKNGAEKAPKRIPFSTISPISYKGIDFGEVCAAADKLWNFYFTADDVCLNRWIVSIDTALDILRDMEEHRHDKHTFGNFPWTCTPEMRKGLSARLDADKAAFEEKELWPDNMDDLKEKLAAGPSCTIDDLMSGESRILVMIAVLARLMVHTAVAHAALWERRADLFAFFTHILVASNRDFDLPFPWHLDITSASYLRTGRTHTRQTNVVDDIVDGAFLDESERTLFIVFVAHYLARQTDAGQVLGAISASSRMKAYFADEDTSLAERRIKFLKSHFEGIS
ncbi:MAG: hypothetical protein IJH50_04845 [Kiritimatiellae bacterium]|nr:hypothetical protein [Kiritimatiellia bacterium]